MKTGKRKSEHDYLRLVITTLHPVTWSVVPLQQKRPDVRLA